MNVTGDWLTAAGTQDLCAALARAGYQALFVGGCVRNALLGLPVADVDIATDAGPAQVVAIAEAAGLRVIPTGIDHGTVTVVAQGVPHEVTTFRRDVTTDGRHAVVAFTGDLAADAARRDLTMNALYAAADGTVIDPLGGLPDLLARRVRFVGDAAQRIAEDHLRILRFFRFHAWYGDPAQGLDPDGVAACAAGVDGVQALSRERVGAEMRKLLSAPDPAPAVAAMAQAGVLARILPGADHRGLAPLVHLEAGLSPRWERRLAVLGGVDIENALRLSRAEARDVAALAGAARDIDSAAALGWKLGAQGGTDAILVRAALQGAIPPDGWEAEVSRGAVAVFPITAADLMPQLSGAALGARLQDLQARWLIGGLTATREELLKN
jgi:poly(A) polymerase